jgi:chemotaxis signal transduction protein
MEAHSGNAHSANSRPGNARQRKNRTAVQSLQLLVFSLGTLKFAVPIQHTYKVVNCDSIHSSGLNHVGITHLDNLEVTVIDLHQRLFKTNHASEAPTQTVLLVVQNSLGELCGIPTATTPTLMDVPLSMIRVLPASYRRADTLDIASHVAVIPQKATTLTLFVLDVEQLLATVLPKPAALPKQLVEDKRWLTDKTLSPSPPKPLPERTTVYTQVEVDFV